MLTSSGTTLLILASYFLDYAQSAFGEWTHILLLEETKRSLQLRQFYCWAHLKRITSYKTAPKTNLNLFRSLFSHDIHLHYTQFQQISVLK